MKKLSSSGAPEGFSNGQLACSGEWQMCRCRVFSRHGVSSSVTLSRVSVSLSLSHTHTHTHTCTLPLGFKHRMF